MQAIEFEADARGRMIEIPEEFEAFASKHLKVKISMDEQSDNMPKKSTRRLSALSIDTLAFKFDREEAAEDKEGLGSRIHRHFSALGGVELTLPNRQPSRKPPDLLE